jgi:hypothetical protein
MKQRGILYSRLQIGFPALARRVHHSTAQANPTQNFADFSKSSENSKNFVYYEEHLNYHVFRVIFAKLWC